MWTAPFINKKYFEGLRWSQSGKRRPPEIIKCLCVLLCRLWGWLVKFWWSLLLESEQQWEALYWYWGLQVGIQDSGLNYIFQIFHFFFLSGANALLWEGPLQAFTAKKRMSSSSTWSNPMGLSTDQHFWEQCEAPITQWNGMTILPGII